MWWNMILMNLRMYPINNSIRFKGYMMPYAVQIVKPQRKSFYFELQYVQNFYDFFVICSTCAAQIPNVCHEKTFCSHIRCIQEQFSLTWLEQRQCSHVHPTAWRLKLWPSGSAEPAESFWPWWGCLLHLHFSGGKIHLPSQPQTQQSSFEKTENKRFNSL